MKHCNKKIIFICESSPKIGLGHLIRCSALSKYFLKKDWQSSLITSEIDKDTMKIVDQSFTTIILKKINQINFLQEIVKNYDLLVIDNYKFSTEKQKLLKKYIKTIIFDDYPHRKVVADYLVDPTLKRRVNEYKKLAVSKCKVLTGIKYVLLRQSFQIKSIIRENFLKYKNLPILIFLGGGYNSILICKIINVLNNSEKLKTIYLICTKNEKNEIQKMKFPNKITFFHSLNDKELFDLLGNVSIVIGASGSSCWERCIMGLPSIIIPISKNQQKIADELDKKNAAVAIKKEDINTKLLPSINSLLLNECNYLQMSKNASLVCDGYGIERLYEIVLSI